VRVIPGDIYRHFKGGFYKILCEATHSETGESLVVYQAFSSSAIYARPTDMFLSEVDHDKYPEVTQKYRFQRI
jgi:hypothetical protein